MSYPRPSARTSIGVLLAVLIFSAFGAAPSVFASGPGPFPPQTVVDPGTVCSPGQMPTQWKDDLHPPATIRVLRSKGPNAGHVETANFWEYVAVVMRAEYSTGADKPPLWMQTGAITVKQYGWYKTMFWGGGRVSFTTTDPNTGISTTSTECYDVQDGTADQIYKPQQTGSDGTIYPGNVPTPPIYHAMAQTWHMTLRKWNSTKNVSRLFLSGYRSGTNVPCGSDTTGFKIFQRSLYDCVNKKLTLEETLRMYFEPVLLVNARTQDSLSDSSWWGDLPVLTASGGNTSWKLYPGKVDGFGSAVSGSFNVSSSVANGRYATGNVDLPQTNTSADDPNMLADMVMVTNDTVYVAKATGNGFSSTLTPTTFSGGAAKVVFGDFDGDLMMDVGLVRFDGTSSSLWVMKAKGDDTFASPVQVWSGAIDLTPASVFVAAGDVNGDGKADLIVRDANGDFQTAVSPPSCSPIGVVATSCAIGSVGAFVLGDMTLALADPGGLGNAKFVVGDYDRDGRADVIAFVGGTTSTVFGMRAKTDGSGFTDKTNLWSSSSEDRTSAQPVAMNVDADGMVDLALVMPTKVQWLRTIERSTGPAQMVLSSDFPHSGKDTTPPSVPTGLVATAVAGLTVNLHWNASTDDTGGTVTYRVFRDGNAIGSGAQLGLTYADHPKAGWHSYTVKAIDAAGNKSAASNKVTVKAFN